MEKKLIYLVLIIAFLFRFVSVSNFPMGLNADEASFGYDAYSILRTGRDQWGNYMPPVLKSFGDYKSPVYAYLAIPSVAAFGLSVFSTRLPNVVIGTLAVLAVYLLINELLSFMKLTNPSFSKWLGVAAAFLLAVNPWSVMMSRGAVEANLISFFLPIGIYFFLKGIKNPIFLIPSALLFGVGMFTYHTAKVLTPLVVMVLLIIFRRQLLNLKLKNLIIPGVVFLLFFVALIYTFGIGGGARVIERSITQGALEEGFQERMTAISKGENPEFAKLFHNKYQVITNRFVNNYLQYFSIKYLITDGAGDASYGMIPGIGVVYVVELLMLFGVVPLIFLDTNSRRIVLVLLIWLFSTPLTAALASGGGYSGNRAGGMLPVLQIVEAFGLYGWLILLKKINATYVSISLLVFGGLFIFEIYGFTNSYFKAPSNSALGQELFGRLEIAKWLEENSTGRTVLVSRSLSEPQIFIAFSNKWNPADFQKNTKTWDFDTSKVTWVDQLPSYSLGNYTIRSIDWKKDTNINSLIAVKADEFSGSQIPVKVISFPDGTPNLYIIDTGQKIYAKAY